jgi:hypothetical protein
VHAAHQCGAASSAAADAVAALAAAAVSTAQHPTSRCRYECVGGVGGNLRDLAMQALVSDLFVDPDSCHSGVCFEHYLLHMT